MNTQDAAAPMPIQRFAEATAYLREYAAPFHPKVLERLSLSSAEVEAAKSHWTRAITEGLQKGDPSTLLAFAKAYARAERYVRLHRLPAGELKPDASLTRTASAPVLPRREMKPVQRSQPAASAQAPQVQARADQLPSYLREDIATAEPRASQISDTAALPAVQEPDIDVDQTAAVSLYQVARGQELPFDPNSPLARLGQLQAATASEQAKRNPPAVSSGERGTVALPDGLEAGAPLPFAEPEVRPEDVDLSMFPIERYAELTLALATSDDRPRVLRRFVLTEAMWKAIAAAWGARFAASPAMKSQFDAALRRLRAGG